jgi:hypothetical protein
MDWSKPVERPIPSAGGLLQSIVSNALPVLSNNLNGRRDPELEKWIDGLGRTVVG